MMQGGVDIALPKAEAKPLEPKSGMVVTIDRGGAIYVDETKMSLTEFRAAFRCIGVEADERRRVPPRRRERAVRRGGAGARDHACRRCARRRSRDRAGGASEFDRGARRAVATGAAGVSVGAARRRRRGCSSSRGPSAASPMPPMYRVSLIAAPPGRARSAWCSPPRRARRRRRRSSRSDATARATPAARAHDGAAAEVRSRAQRRRPRRRTLRSVPHRRRRAAPAGGGPKGGRGARRREHEGRLGSSFPYPVYLHNIVRQIAAQVQADAPVSSRRKCVHDSSRRHRRRTSTHDVVGIYSFDQERWRPSIAAHAHAFGPLPRILRRRASVIFSFHPGSFVDASPSLSLRSPFWSSASLSAPLVAQDTTRGVRIGLTYDPGTKPGVACSRSGVGADSVRAIVQRDLDFGDEFSHRPLDGRVRRRAPRGGGPNWALLARLGAAAAVQMTLDPDRPSRRGVRRARSDTALIGDYPAPPMTGIARVAHGDSPRVG